MPRRDPVPRFVHEFALDPTPHQARLLGIRLDLARQFYNACLGEAQRRFKRCWRDPRWVEARELKQQKATAESKALFKAVIKEHGFSAYSLTGIVKDVRTAHFRGHLDFKSCQAMAVRAFQAVEKARFVNKGEARAVDSVSIHWRGDSIEWQSPAYGLQIPALFDTEDKKGIEAHALALMADEDALCESKRIVRRVIRGHERWYCQLTLKGSPAWKAQYEPGHGKTVGLDIGPTMLAIVSEGKGQKLKLAEGLAHDYAKIRRIQRAMDRSRRATNPDAFDLQGRFKRGARLTYSKGYRRLKARYTELWRKYAARRKNELGRLANAILTLGTTIKTEALDYRAWQKHWGKSIGRGAPGLLIGILRRKVEQINLSCAQEEPGRALKGKFDELPAALPGAFIEFSTRHTKFSQLCHGCGSYAKKPLKLRMHHCDCGIGPLDRDIYSAFLAYHYDLASQALDIGAARATFAALQCRGGDVQGVTQTASAGTSVCQLLPEASAQQSGSPPDGALDTAERTAKVGAGKRQESIPTFQAIPHHHASIEAGTQTLGDARSDLPQHNGLLPQG